MADNFFPSAKYFDEMGDYLEMIAIALADKVEVDISNWASIQKAVRMGIAPKILPIGTQLVANHSVYGELKLDVVAHNHYESYESKNANTMTLMCHDAVVSIRFDEPEAFYYAENELPAGTYNFISENVSYQFTLSNSLSKGGVLLIYPRDDGDIQGKSIAAFDSPTQPVPDTYVVEKGSAGTNLGTLGEGLNAYARTMYGSNYYKESAVRQFLNSDNMSGKVWTAQNKFDFPPEWYSALAGFARGLDAKLLAVIGKVKVPCLASSYDLPRESELKYTLKDKFFIPSRIEVGAATSGEAEDGSSLLPYFKGASNEDRIKYLGNNKCNYWLRGNGSSIYALPYVANDGSIMTTFASSTASVVPMFNIV